MPYVTRIEKLLKLPYMCGVFIRTRLNKSLSSAMESSIDKNSQNHYTQ